MDAERYRRVKELVHEAGSREGAERSQYLEEACRGDPELRREVEELLSPASVPTRELVGALVDGSDPSEESADAGFAPVLSAGRHGRYRVGALIGRGGMGAVYEAHDERRDRRVALKVVHPQLLGTTSVLERFVREAEVGRAIRHPNVIRTYGADSISAPGGALRALVMEYVEGRTLQQLLDDLGALPETLVREIAVQIASGLAAIHAAGIVHRDLKPANVILTRDERVRIMDLGVAKLTDASTDLTQQGHFVGSFAYAAPEQFLGEDVGPAADLYAVGVLLYELASGDNPFRGDSPAQAMRAHRHLSPLALEDRRRDVSRFLSELVATLLAKRAADRVGSAAALRTILIAGEAGEWWRERRSELAVRTQRLPRVPVARDTRMRGRDGDLARLREVWDAAQAGDGGVVLIEGAGGLGKSRLVDSLVRSLPAREAHVLYGSFPPEGGLRGVLRAVRNLFDEHELEQRLGALLEQDAHLVPAFASVVRAGRLQAVERPLAAEALGAMVHALLGALARERPTLWIIEDLHFAGDEGRALAGAAARAAAGHAALVVLTTRPSAGGVAAGLPRRLHMQLESLDEQDVVALIRDRTASDDAAEQLGPRVAQLSDGIPFHVIEIVRALADPDRLRQAVEGGDLGVPDAVRDLLSARVNELPPDQRAILDVGAVHGFHFDAELVARVTERPLVTVLRTLAEIERAHGLVQPSGSRYRFEHHLLQEVVYEELPLRLREEYHALLAAAFRDHLDHREEAVNGGAAVFLVHHHLRGSRPADAVPHLRIALDHLRARHLMHSAVDLAERALAIDGLLAAETRFDMLLEAGFHLFRAGRRGRQRVVLDEAVALAQELAAPHLEARAYAARAEALAATWDTDGACADFDRQLDAAVRARDPVQGLRARIGRAQALQWTRPPDAIEELAHASLERARALGDGRTVRNALQLRGTLAMRQGRYEAAARAFEEQRLEAVRTAGPREVALAELSLGIALHPVGRYDEARTWSLAALEKVQQLGERHLECHGIGTLALIAGDRGLLAESERLLVRQREISEQVNSSGDSFACSLHLARLHRRLGDNAGADAALAELLERLPGLADPNLDSNLRLELAWVALAERRVTDARTYALEGLAAAESVANVCTVVGLLDVLAAIDLADGDRDAAVSRLDLAEDAARDVDLPLLHLARETRRVQAGGDPAALVGALALWAERVDRRERMLACFELWRATGDRSHLDAACKDLTFLRDHAPPEHRESILTDVPSHRVIVEAWEADARERERSE